MVSFDGMLAHVCYSMLDIRKLLHCIQFCVVNIGFLCHAEI